MKVISRVEFPKTTEIADLYIKYDKSKVDVQTRENKIVVTEGSTLSLNTYFNSIYEKLYTQYTSINSLYYLLKLEGDFAIAAYREYQASAKELIDCQTFKGCQLSDYVKLILPELKQSQEAGRIYLEITCLSEQGLFTEGLVVTEQQKQRDVSLAIISCTYKKETYIKNTINTVLQDKLLQDKQFKVFVVDNGSTLNQSDFYHPRVKLISNRNFGGSGGFTKGLISALQEGSYTHFLFMDDDIELDSEVIYRLFSLYEYAQHDFAVAGSMLDLYKKHVLYEAGGLYNKNFDTQGNLQQRSLAVTALKHNLDLRNTDALNSILIEDNIDYGGFWFFSFSKEVVDKIGLLLPFFIKIDDMEFGLRINKHCENGIVAFPSIAVWHEPFYTKRPGWDVYYYTRNSLITDAIHGYLRYFDTIKMWTECIIYNLLIFDYNTARLFLKAFDDYMQGPDFIRSKDPENLHVQICQFSKSHKSQTILKHTNLPSTATITKANKFQRILTLLTLNGHLLPQFLIKDESAIIRSGMEESDSICKGFAKRRVILAFNHIPHSYQNELDNQAGINILLSWVKSALSSSWKWSNVTRKWKQAAQDFTSIQFWQDYLEPH